MPLASRVTVDTAGGLITGGGQSFVTVQGKAVSVVGDAVASHGSSPHSSATIAQGSAFVTINGIPVCFAGKLATCGHAATGSGHLSVSA